MCPHSRNDLKVFSNCVCFVSIVEPANDSIKNLFGFWCTSMYMIIDAAEDKDVDAKGCTA
jgi:hypothetical protein